MATTNQTPQDTADKASPTALASLDLSRTVTGPFFPIDGLDRFRPYYSYLEPHDPSSATIILTQKVVPSSPSTETTDYLNSFNSKLDTLLPDAVADNKSIPILDLGSGERSFYGVFRNFSLLQYSETRQEIAKVALNFGSRWNAYFFGAKPRVYNFGGFFIDSKNYPYYEQFMKAYDKYLAGGRCVSNGFRLYMVYDNKITTGWMLGINISSTSDQEFSRTFSFQLLVDDENWFRTNWEYDINGEVIDFNSRNLTNKYQIPGISK